MGRRSWSPRPSLQQQGRAPLLQAMALAAATPQAWLLLRPRVPFAKAASVRSWSWRPRALCSSPPAGLCYCEAALRAADGVRCA